MKRPVEFRKGRLAENLIDQYVTIFYKGRDWLGTVKTCSYNHIRGVYELGINHFNGEPWPFIPTAGSVYVLDWLTAEEYAKNHNETVTPQKP